MLSLFSSRPDKAILRVDIHAEYHSKQWHVESSLGCGKGKTLVAAIAEMMKP